MRKLLFLDIDGVLNDHAFNEVAESSTLLGRCVKNLNLIVKRVPDLEVVLSSAWRYQILMGTTTLRGFGYMLRTHGVSKDMNLIGHTPSDEEVPQRGEQIMKFILQKAWPCRVAILDDGGPGMSFTPLEHVLFMCKGKVGLTRRVASNVIEHFLSAPEEATRVCLPRARPGRGNEGKARGDGRRTRGRQNAPGCAH